MANRIATYLRGEEDMKSRPKPSERLDVQLRWLIRRDMPDVLAIEHACFDRPWVDEDFLRCLRQRNCIGMVAEHEHNVVGFMVYELHKSRLHILDFAVAPENQRQGFGTAMVGRLIGKLSQQRRKELRVEVRESNLTAQLFFQSMGFEAINIEREMYDDTGEDGYVMCYRLRGLETEWD